MIKGVKVKFGGTATPVMTIEQARNVKLVLDRIFSPRPMASATERRKGAPVDTIGTYDEDSGVIIITP